MHYPSWSKEPDVKYTSSSSVTAPEKKQCKESPFSWWGAWCDTVEYYYYKSRCIFHTVSMLHSNFWASVIKSQIPRQMCAVKECHTDVVTSIPPWKLSESRLNTAIKANTTEGRVRACVRLSTICKAAPYLLSHWTQIKAFHSNSLSGNRGTRYFIYHFSYAAAGAKWFIKVWRLNKSRKHVIF